MNKESKREASKEKSLRDWFGRKGAKGSKGGWVDCNAPDGDGGYRACGRSSGEKRKRYPACRPTPGACKEKGKGKSWGKKGKKKSMLLSDSLELFVKNAKKKKKKKDDACTRKVKARYDVWPSAYASGAVTKCRQVGAANWGNKSKKSNTKVAYGYQDDYGLFERFEPLYYGSEMKRPAVAKAMKAFAESLAKSNPGLRVGFSDKRYEEGVSAEEAAKLMEKGDFYPYFYDAQMPMEGKEKLTDEAVRNIDAALFTSLGLEPPKDEDYYRLDDSTEPAMELSDMLKNFLEQDKKILAENLAELEALEKNSAEYRGRKVTLNKPTRGDVKKFKVYVKDPSTGKVKKVNFGDPNMKIRKSNPKARKSFRARHNCDNPGPKTKARYWSCKKW